MANIDSSLTGTNAKHVQGFSPGGNFVSLPTTETINTVTLAAADVQRLFRVSNGNLLNMIHLETADADTGTQLDMDLVLVDDNGTTVLYNAGGAFQSAVDDWIELGGVKVVADDDPDAHVGFLINTAAQTGVAAASVKATLFFTS